MSDDPNGTRSFHKPAPGTSRTTPQLDFPLFQATLPHSPSLTRCLETERKRIFQPAWVSRDRGHGFDDSDTLGAGPTAARRPHQEIVPPSKRRVLLYRVPDHQHPAAVDLSSYEKRESSVLCEHRDGGKTKKGGIDHETKAGGCST